MEKKSQTRGGEGGLRLSFSLGCPSVKRRHGCITCITSSSGMLLGAGALGVSALFTRLARRTRHLNYILIFIFNEKHFLIVIIYFRMYVAEQGTWVMRELCICHALFTFSATGASETRSFFASTQTSERCGMTAHTFSLWDRISSTLGMVVLQAHDVLHSLLNHRQKIFWNIDIRPLRM